MIVTIMFDGQVVGEPMEMEEEALLTFILEELVLGRTVVVAP